VSLEEVGGSDHVTVPAFVMPGSRLQALVPLDYSIQFIEYAGVVQVREFTGKVLTG